MGLRPGDTAFMYAAAQVFRIRPDGDEYLQEAEKNKDLLPSLVD